MSCWVSDWVELLNCMALNQVKSSVCVFGNLIFVYFKSTGLGKFIHTFHMPFYIFIFYIYIREFGVACYFCDATAQGSPKPAFSNWINRRLLEICWYLSYFCINCYEMFTLNHISVCRIKYVKTKNHYRYSLTPFKICIEKLFHYLDIILFQVDFSTMTNELVDAEMETDIDMERQSVRTAEAATSITKDTGNICMFLHGKIYTFCHARKFWSADLKFHCIH